MCVPNVSQMKREPRVIATNGVSSRSKMSWCPSCEKKVEIRIKEDRLLGEKRGETLYCKHCNAELLPNCLTKHEYLKAKKRNKIRKRLSLFYDLVHSFLLEPIFFVLGAVAMLIFLLYLMSILGD